MVYADNYARLLADRLLKFKQVRAGIFNFRCPICGDSKTDPGAARGYIYSLGEKPNMHCFNCGHHSSLKSFVKTVAPDLHRQWVFDELASGNIPGRRHSTEAAAKAHADPLVGETWLVQHNLDRITDLPPNHKAVEYVRERLIPRHQWDRLWFVQSMRQLDDNSKSLAPRLAIPIYDRHFRLVAITCRALEDDVKPRYQTFTVCREVPQVFGAERVDTGQVIYVTEGPLDSLFIPNCVAATGTFLERALQVIPTGRFVFILDNQPRHSDVVAAAKRLIAGGHTVFIPPPELVSKDINSMVLNQEVSIEGLPCLLSQNAFSGLTAQVKLAKWAKVGDSE